MGVFIIDKNRMAADVLIHTQVCNGRLMATLDRLSSPGVYSAVLKHENSSQCGDNSKRL